MSEKNKENKELGYQVNFSFCNELREDRLITYGSSIKAVEMWTEADDLNPKMVETIGYVPIEKLIERSIQAGEDLVFARLKEGMYSNEEGDNEFHDSPFDDISLLSLDELQNLQRETADNFYTKKALLASVIRQKNEQKKQEQELSTPQVEAEAINKPQA